MPRKALSPQRRRFVDAYLTTAKGNGTKAALAAGYSPRTAGVQASQLLKAPEVKAAIDRTLAKESLTAEQALQNVSALANTVADDISDATILKANELILRVHGALQTKHHGPRITVNIGFLSTNPPAGVTATVDAEVLPPRPHLTISGESAPGEAGECAGRSLALAGESHENAEE